MSLMPWFGGGRGGMDPFSSDLWDPFGSPWPLDDGRREGGSRDDATAMARTNVDWHENDKEHIFSAEIPGVRKEDVKVEVEDGNVLKISGEKTREEEHKGDAWNRVERSFGSFMRRFRLPEKSSATQPMFSRPMHGRHRLVIVRSNPLYLTNVRSYPSSTCRA